MQRSIFPLIATTFAGFALAACSSSMSASSSTSVPSNAGAVPTLAASSDCHAYLAANRAAKLVTTSNYVMVSGVGPSEVMYSKAEVDSKKPISGELMVSGMMEGDNSMAMKLGGTMMNLETHICSKVSGKAVTGAMPTLSLVPAGSSSSPINIPAAEMTSLDGKASDTHYGNNVEMVAGKPYKLRVSLNGQTGTFLITSVN